VIKATTKRGFARPQSTEVVAGSGNYQTPGRGRGLHPVLARWVSGEAGLLEQPPPPR